MMRGLKPSTPSSNTRPIIFFTVFLTLAFLIVRSTFSSSSSDGGESLTSYIKSQNCPSSCSKIPPSLSNALIHYATSNITPQQTSKEISVTERVLLRKSPCNFLVFGLGHDSLMWASLNHGGRTVFLEEDKMWIQNMKSKQPSLESHHVTYNTKVRNADVLLSEAREEEECSRVVDPRESKCGLALRDNLPKEVYDVEWDLIMVDAPTGYHNEAPGRMQAIYTAGLMGRNREEGETDVFVHDVDRSVEDKFSKEYLCEGYMVEQVGKLRHFTIPSHRTRLGRPFCPTITSKNIG